MSECPTDFLKLYALTILSIQTVLQDFVPSLSGLVLRDPHSAGEGVAMVGKFAARTWLCTDWAALKVMQPPCTETFFFWKRCTYGRLIIVKDAGVLFGLNLIVYGGIITLKKDMCDPLAISCIHSYWMIWFCVALPTYIFSWIDLLIPITPKCGIFSWFPRRWSGEYVDLFQSLGCSILPSLGVGICSITAMAKTFVASFVSWFLPKIIGGHIYFLLQFFSFVLFGKKNIKQIRSEDWRFIREEVTRRFFPNEKASQNLEPEAGSWDLGESVWSQWSGLGFGGSTATWINWESKGTGNEDD